jgi:hypothetical protein
MGMALRCECAAVLCGLALLLSSGGHAGERQASPAPSPSAPSSTSSTSDDLSKQLEEALKAATPTSTPVSSSIATAGPSRPGTQSLNPDISVILDATGGLARHAPLRLAGDDPDLGGSGSQKSAGVTLQEAEVAAQSVVDPYLRADVFLTIPNTSVLEVEEAFATSTGLAGGLQVKAGVFRSALGRQNGQHLHLQDFTRRPLLNASYLGTDGLRAPGLQISWLLPTPFFLMLVGEAFSVSAPDSLDDFSSFGGGKRTDLTYTAELKSFTPLTPSLSLAIGLNGATGISAGRLGIPPTPNSVTGAAGPTPVLFGGSRTILWGADVYLKWKPPNVSGGYYSLAWQTEYFGRNTARDSVNDLAAAVDGGLYSQLVFQFARRWFVGMRFDALGLPKSHVQPRVNRESVSLTLTPSEFSRIRVYGEREERMQSTSISPSINYAAFVQLEVALGAHGAHPF